MRKVFVLAAVLALAACAGRPHGVLKPIGARPPQANEVSILVATTRSEKGAGPGEMFSGERGDAPSFAEISVSIPPDGARQIGEVQWPQGETPDPAREFATVRAEVLSREAAVARFDARIANTPKRHALVFVHGFNTRFEEAVYRFAQIVHDSRAPALPVLFTWPSRGKLLEYTYDHESANFSRDSLENLLRALDRDKNVGEISILAHSMGNWVTMEALRQMAIRDKGLAPKIRNIMLAAPDVDYDVFQRQIAQIGAKPSLFTIFVSRDDQALATSKRVWGDKVRLGAVDPEKEPVRDQLAREKINVVDLTGVESGDRLGHGTFAEAPAVVRSIGLRLSQGQTLADSQAGVGDRVGAVATGAAGAVGGAAGVAVSLPISVIDPRTRENLGDRVEDVGARIGDTVNGATGR